MNYIKFWKGFRDFSGKTSRSVFWRIVFIHVGISFLLFFGCIFLSAFLVVNYDFLSAEFAPVLIRVVDSLFQLFSMPSLIAMTTRRLNDAGYGARSYWWLLCPVIGTIAFVSRLCENSKE